MLIEEPSLVLIDGRRIAYDEVSLLHPKGTVLLLTGADSNRLTWYKQLDVFGRAFRTIAVDYRDTGDSDPASGPYTIADLADDAAFVLATLGVQRALVVGISLEDMSACRWPYVILNGSRSWCSCLPPLLISHPVRK